MPQSYARTLGRISLFIIYFWFGILKLLGLSPATPLVLELFDKTIARTLPFISFDQFTIAFALFEMLIGVMFLFPRLFKITALIFLAHMGMTSAPLLLVPKEVWTSFLVPTLEGQYIIKNLALISVVGFLASSRRD